MSKPTTIIGELTAKLQATFESGVKVAGGLSYDSIDGTIYYVTSDSELDDALAVADDGDKIQLGKGVFTANRTFTTDLTFEGIGIRAGGTGSSEIQGNWTFDSNSRGIIRSVEANVTSFEFNHPISEVSECQFSSSTDIIFNDNKCRYINNNDGSVTFGSDASGGIVDACSGTTVSGNTTDNTVGTIG